MSGIARLLNLWLRRFEKPAMARAAGPAALRKRFDRNARLFFQAPRGTQMQWHRLEHNQRGVEALEVVPPSLETQKAVLYFHGGAFVFGRPQTHAAMLGTLSAKIKRRALLPKYRLAPEAPFPAAFDDARTAWDGLIRSGVPAGDIVIGGDSAGGAIALALLGQLLRDGAELPAGVFCFSPLTDMRFNSDSFRKNAKLDAVLVAERAGEAGQMYLGDVDPTDPRVSPLFGDYTGAPPVWITVGDTEILLDDSREIVRHMQSVGVEVTYVEEHDLPHVWPIFHNTLPEARATLDQLAAWIKGL